jgi:adenine-specific DNA-methyltransferase
MSDLAVSELANRKRKADLGQFFTSPPLANFMASWFDSLPAEVRLLDAGAGAGSLTSAVVSRFCKKRAGVRAIDATLFEIDPLIQEALLECMGNCAQECAEAGIEFTFKIHAVDFIEDITSRLSGDLFSLKAPLFNAAIANPPYRKIATDSVERRQLRQVGVETSNLYSGFIALIHRLLVPGGQLVGITPRSFCNGPYFRPFREDFLANLDLKRLHVFESRGAAFRVDDVLQENVIFHAIKDRPQSDTVIISSSSGENGAVVTQKTVRFTEVVHTNDEEKFIHIPSTARHSAAKEAMDGLYTSLASLGLNVSTGPVVEYRLKTSIRWQPEENSVPLLYPCHLNRGTVRWPKPDSRKPNAILNNEMTRPWLVQSGVYVLTKRFTSKEENRRLVACLFDPEGLEAEWIGIENHLNYIHANGRGLDMVLAIGLLVFLNSTIVDQYFRRFSGHTQVNATDLRKLPYPDLQTLLAMGKNVNRLDEQQQTIDNIVEKYI